MASARFHRKRQQTEPRLADLDDRYGAASSSRVLSLDSRPNDLTTSTNLIKSPTQRSKPSSRCNASGRFLPKKQIWSESLSSWASIARLFALSWGLLQCEVTISLTIPHHISGHSGDIVVKRGTHISALIMRSCFGLAGNCRSRPRGDFLDCPSRSSEDVCLQALNRKIADVICFVKTKFMKPLQPAMRTLGSNQMACVSQKLWVGWHVEVAGGEIT